MLLGVKGATDLSRHGRAVRNAEGADVTVNGDAVAAAEAEVVASGDVEADPIAASAKRGVDIIRSGVKVPFPMVMDLLDGCGHGFFGGDSVFLQEIIEA